MTTSPDGPPKRLYMLKSKTDDRWVRYGTDVAGRLYAHFMPWDGPAGPPSVFTDLDTLQAVAALVPGVGLEAVAFLAAAKVAL